MVDPSSGSSGIDLNSLLQSALAGKNMSNLLGGNDGIGSGLVLGLLLGRTGLLGNNWDGNNQNSDRAAIESAVASALAQNNQANNNFGILLKDIQDTGQDITGAITASNNNLTSTITNGNQNLLVQFLQGQIANLQGQSNIINEIHEAEQALASSISNDGDKTRAAIAALAAQIPTSRELDLQRQLAVAQEEERLRRISSIVDSGNVTVTNNINQNQQQQQQQQQIWNINNLLQDLLAQQKITQGIVNLGTMTGSAGSQTAANTRVNS